MKPTRDEVRDYFFEVMKSMADEPSDIEVTEDSRVMGDLNWRSIELVYIAQSIQQHYERVLPFQEFVKDLEQRGQKDISVREFVDFVYEHLDDAEIAVPFDPSTAFTDPQ